MKHMALIVLAAGALVMAPVLPTAADLIDFSLDAGGNAILPGQIIDDEYAADGLTISVVNNGGGPNLGVAFDSANPTGNDPDLATPSWSGLGSNPNDVLGNLLIIQENGVESTLRPGFVNRVPDDEAGGGQIILDFTNGITEFGVHIVDVEVSESQFFIQLWSGANLVETVTRNDLSVDTTSAYYDPSIQWGNNSVNQIQSISAADIPNYGSFDRVIVNFQGSGAIDRINYSVVPEPSSMALLGLGLAGMIVRRRRIARGK